MCMHACTHTHTYTGLPTINYCVLSSSLCSQVSSVLYMNIGLYVCVYYKDKITL